MQTVTLDLETTQPAWRDGEKGWEDGKFAPLSYHEPACYCWLVANAASASFEMKARRTDETSESDIIQELGEDIRNAGRLVTFNGRTFDMPLCGLRAFKHAVDWSFWPDCRHRYPNYKKALFHYDMQELLGDYGAARGIRLDGVTKLLGFPGKDGIDGSQVQSYWLELGKRQEVVDYCVRDVGDTFLCYLRYIASYVGQDVSVAWDGFLAWASAQPQLAGRYDQGSEA